MKFILALLLAACASVPTPEPASVCYTVAENAALREAFKARAHEIENLEDEAYAEWEHRRSFKLRNDGYLGYCT